MRPMNLKVIIDSIYILETVKQFLGYLKMGCGGKVKWMNSLFDISY